MSVDKIYGIAINDADYQVRKTKWENGKTIQLWICPYYKVWMQMLVRCYSDKFNSQYKFKYKRKVCKSWLTFSNFRSWMEEQDWERKELDKDIFGEGSGIYSPKNCIFISSELNKFFNLRSNIRSGGDLPVGVSANHKRGKPYVSATRIHGKKKQLGQFDDPLEAHFVWLAKKIELLEEIISNEKDLRLINQLIKINNHLKQSLKDKVTLTSFYLSKD